MGADAPAHPGLPPLPRTRGSSTSRSAGRRPGRSCCPARRPWRSGCSTPGCELAGERRGAGLRDDGRRPARPPRRLRGRGAWCRRVRGAHAEVAAVLVGSPASVDGADGGLADGARTSVLPGRRAGTGGASPPSASGCPHRRCRHTAGDPGAPARRGAHSDRLAGHLARQASRTHGRRHQLLGPQVRRHLSQRLLLRLRRAVGRSTVAPARADALAGHVVEAMKCVLRRAAHPGGRHDGRRPRTRRPG